MAGTHSTASGEALVEALSGMLGGSVALASTFPLMTVIARVQTRVKSSPSNASPSLTQQLGTVDDTSRKDAGLATRKQDVSEWLNDELVWFRSLYAGLRPALLGTVCSQGVYYYFYSLFRAVLTGSGAGHSKSLSVAGSIFVSSLAGCMNVLITNPLWVIVTRMQTSSGGFLETASLMYREEQMKSVLKGLLPALLMVSNPVFQFAILEFLTRVLRARLRRKGGGQVLSAGSLLIIGALAKLGATVLTYPLLVVKSLLQVSGKGAHNLQHYAGMADALMTISRKEGIQGFYRGMSTKIVQSTLAAAILYLVRARVSMGARRLVLAVQGSL
ncbi:Peroxisomal nicotinamide adenine dinucleotide carrier [Porphyridium purpureum]|uniref:Peroxisomal nicotinamide adenine dinucleotide carrier n=1 Tax=Porphyridium purpureum TaxID=35688 RepID=A0A5J4Z7E1_PORPP|nr:Peroxisomal nicotinamide adenine dinucleotide carrier [Porphyridium purpureum]|eukprot:POR5865..scf295_1